MSGCLALFANLLLYVPMSSLMCTKVMHHLIPVFIERMSLNVRNKDFKQSFF